MSKSIRARVEASLNQVKLRLTKNWHVFGPCFACGYAYVKGELLQEEGLARYFAASSVDEFERKMREASGFFATVQTEGNVAWIGVDHVASYPLFYAFSGNQVWLSDDPYWIAEQLRESRFDSVSVAEFLLSGNVTGHETLYPRVKRIQAGEMLFVEATTEDVATTLKEYYRFSHQDFFTENEEWLLRAADAAVIEGFERTIRSVNGRTIAVSLSGGYDSRLVAMMLRRLGYGKVICFSYGLPSYVESTISKKVAKELGFDWEFVPYSHKTWFEWFHSEERKRCHRFSDGLTSSPFVQDWPAISKMKQDEIIPDDSVIIQGQGGDLMAGGLLPNELWTGRRFGLEFVVSKLRQRYCWWNLQGLGYSYFPESISSVLSRMNDKWRAFFADAPCETAEEAANLINIWHWKHRSKLWWTSLQAHQFHGYDWRVPLWEPVIAAFWRRVPLRHRFGKSLYAHYVRGVQKDVSVTTKVLTGTNPYPQGYPFMDFLHATHLAEPLAKSGVFGKTFKVSGWLRNLSYKKVYDNHRFAWYGVMSQEQYGRIHARKPANLYGILAAERLGLISF